MRSGSRITRRAAFVGVTAVGGVLGVPAVLRAQAPVRLTLGHGQTPGNPRSVAADRMAAQLRRASGSLASPAPRAPAPACATSR